MKNILAENMLRFGVKNLNDNNKTNLLILTEAPITAPSGGAQPVTITTPQEAKQVEQQINTDLMNAKQKKIVLATLKQEADEEADARNDFARQQKIDRLQQRYDKLTDQLVASGKTMPRDVRKALEKQLELAQKELAAFNGELQQSAPADERHKDEAVKGWVSVFTDSIGIISTAISAIAAYASYKAGVADREYEVQQRNVGK